MTLTKVKSYLSAITLLLISPLMLAAVPTWKMVPADSSISFIATQNDAPVKGQFKKFEGDIAFDPSQLNESHVNISVTLSSVTTSYDEVVKALQSPDWFNPKVFPKAEFKSTSFTKTGDKTYQANGILTIRDKTIPVVLIFTLKEYTDTKASVVGSTNLKRTDFGVGQGEWAKTDGVKDEVKVDFTINATK
jgi:polyisoprenoid-binding protein YceI